jgi:glutamate-1-semialdehyde 2,1-aminomutase
MTELNLEKSRRLFEQSSERIPGGVNSPVRAFRSVGGTPPFISRGSGARIWDVDGNDYVDHVCSWGPLLFGHAHPAILEAVNRAAARGTSFGAPTEAEYRLAEAVHRFLPSMEKIRLVSSGTEATMSAVRLARGFTGRDAVIKFNGCYHGHSDGFLVQAGSGATTLGSPDSPGVIPGTVAATLQVPFNDLEAAKETAAANSERLAAVIVEPVAGNMGVIPPQAGFLQGLRQLCDRHGALLIFDEVITGFRLARGGAQELFGIRPDLTTLGKILGGGLPLGAFGGRSDVMEALAPSGPVYQAGTLSGNPVAVAAGLAALGLIEDDPDLYNRLDRTTARLVDELQGHAADKGAPIRYQRVGSMFTHFFTGEERVTDYKDATACDTGAFRNYFGAMLERGVYFAPSAFEAAFVSAAHRESDLEQTVEAHRAVLDVLQD